MNISSNFLLLLSAKYFGIEQITNLDKEFSVLQKTINNTSQHKYNLKKSYVNEKGQNQYFNQSDNFDNLGKISETVSNYFPHEYKGQALIKYYK